MGDRLRKRSLESCASSLRSSSSKALKDASDVQGAVAKKLSQRSKRRRTGKVNSTCDNESTCEEENQSLIKSSQSNDKNSPSSLTCPSNHNLSKLSFSDEKLTQCTLQSPHTESGSISCNSHIKPQQLLSTSCSDSLISSKASFVQASDERNQTSINVASLDLETSEKPIYKYGKQCNDADIQLTAQPNISENSEIQASILALESLLQVNPNLKTKDIRTKSLNKTHISEKIATRNNKWEDDEKLGARATLGPVLYSNICLNLKETHPEWTSRAATIAYIWHRQLSSETRKIYSEMAKRNRQLLNSQLKGTSKSQVDKTEGSSKVNGSTLAHPTSTDTNLSVQKSQDSSSSTTTTYQSFQPSKTRQSKSLSSYTEVYLENNIKNPGQQSAICRRPAIKSDSSLSVKKTTFTSNLTAKESAMDAKKFMEQSTDAQIEFFRTRARYLQYRKATTCLILNDDLCNDVPSNKECMLTGEYGNAKLKGNWDTYASYPLHNKK